MEHPPISSTRPLRGARTQVSLGAGTQTAPDIGSSSWLRLDGSRSALQRLGARRAAGLIAALTLLFIGLRCVNLDADVPLSFGRRSARELLAEPAAKSHEARNFALFDAFHLNAADDYQFWRAQSPLWVYPLAGFFKSFGTDWPQLRLFSTLYAALGVIGLLAIAVRFVSPVAVCFTGALLACDSVYFHYSRAGLLEPAVNSWLSLCMLALLLAERRVLWLIAAHWAFALAFFTKQAALIALPVVALASVWLLWPRPTQAAGSGRDRLVVIAHALVVCGLSLLYIWNSDYWRAVSHNFNHMLLGSDAPSALQYTGVGSLFTRIVADHRYRHFFTTLPLTGPLSLLASGALAYELVRARRLPYAPLVLFGWLACALGSMLTIAYSALRFWTIVVLPAALIAAIALDALHGAFARAGQLRAFRGLAVIGGLVLFGAHAYTLREPLLAPSFTLRDSARDIVRTIGARDATVVGARSALMLLGTPYKNYYVKGGFNASRHQLLQLSPTHFLFVSGGDATQGIIERELPEVSKGLTSILQLKVRGGALELFSAESRLTSREPKAAVRP